MTIARMALGNNKSAAEIIYNLAQQRGYRRRSRSIRWHEADIGAAINNRGRMQELLNQLYGRRSTISPGDSGGFGNEDGRDASNYQPGQAPTASAATPDTDLPFGWAGLPALQR
jgi:hypothetical protein